MPISGTPLTDVLERNEQLQADYDALLDSAKWAQAVMSVLLEQEGGIVHLSKDTLQNYDLRSRVVITDEGDFYNVEVIPFEGDEQ